MRLRKLLIIKESLFFDVENALFGCFLLPKKGLFRAVFFVLAERKVNFFAYFPFPFPLSARLELYISQL